MGGTGNIINGLEKLMKEENINIIKGQEVDKYNYFRRIRFKELSLTSIKEIINANNVICNADPPGVYEKLIT